MAAAARLGSPEPLAPAGARSARRSARADRAAGLREYLVPAVLHQPDDAAGRSRSLAPRSLGHGPAAALALARRPRRDAARDAPSSPLLHRGVDVGGLVDGGPARGNRARGRCRPRRRLRRLPLVRRRLLVELGSRERAPPAD